LQDEHLFRSHALHPDGQQNEFVSTYGDRQPVQVEDDEQLEHLEGQGLHLLFDKKYPLAQVMQTVESQLEQPTGQQKS
jgi:hypothetical protein